MTPRQFRRRFRTERDCLRYVTGRKWPDGFRCPRCDHDQAYLIESRRLYQCKECGHQTSVTANTIFHKTRKPLRDWFWAIFVVATRTTGSSARQLQYDLGLSYPTAWTWCHKIRKAMEDRDTRYSLRGVVELDDTYMGGKKKPGKRGRGAAGKTSVLVAVESRPKGCGHTALATMPVFSSEQAHRFVTGTVHADSVIHTDGLYLYCSLAQHYDLRQTTLKDGHKPNEILPHVHRVIARVKTWIRGTHSHVSPKHLHRYLAEFSYRFNRRFTQRRATIFDRLVTACCISQGVTYKQLIAEVT